MEEYLNYVKVASNMIRGLTIILIISIFVTNIYLFNTFSDSKSVTVCSVISLIFLLIGIIMSIIDYEDRIKKAGLVYLERVNPGIIHYSFILSRVFIIISTLLVSASLLIIIV